MTIRGRICIDPRIPKPDTPDAVSLYAWVDPETLPLLQRKNARRIAERTANQLGLGSIRVRWFRLIGPLPASDRVGSVGMLHPADEEPPDWFWGRPGDTVALGIAPPDQPNTIGLEHSLDGDVLVAVIRHEVRHLWQERRNMPPAEREADADAYAAAYGRAA